MTFSQSMDQFHQELGVYDEMEDTLYDSESVRRLCLGGADVD